MHNHLTSLNIAQGEVWWWMQQLRPEDQDSLRKVRADIERDRAAIYHRELKSDIDRLTMMGRKLRSAYLRNLRSTDLDAYHRMLILAHHRAYCAWQWLVCLNQYQIASPMGRDPTLQNAVSAAEAADEFHEKYPPFWPFYDD